MCNKSGVKPLQQKPSNVGGFFFAAQLLAPFLYNAAYEPLPVFYIEKQELNMYYYNYIKYHTRHGYSADL